MKDVDFSKAVKALPPFCLGLMQNVPPEDQQKLKKAVEDLEGSDAEASVKSLLLGLELMNVVGKDVLTTAVTSLGEQIQSLPKA